MCIDLEYLLCRVELAGNAEARKRVITIETNENIYQLDFTKEPGEIASSEGCVGSDPAWGVAESPLVCMLTAFLKWVSEGVIDPRLDINIGLNANALIMQVNNMARCL